MMNVRQPVAVHAPALRSIIRTGAPRIERVLREARHVHTPMITRAPDPRP